MCIPGDDLVRLLVAISEPVLGMDPATAFAIGFVSDLIIPDCESGCPREITCRCGDTLSFQSDDELADVILAHLQERTDHLSVR